MSPIRNMSRRDFLKIAGAASSAVLLASCKKGTGTSVIPLDTGGAAAAPTTAAPSLPPGSKADVILTGGKVMTVDSANSVAEALAIQGNRILSVGTNQAIGLLADSATQVIELSGRAVTPGLIDPHLHFSVFGLQNGYYTPFMPPEVKDIPSMQRAMTAYLKDKPSGEWVMGYYLGFSDKMIPTVEDLDPVSKSNPVFLMHIGGHWGTANSVAMQLAGITDSTKSPEGGIIEKKNGHLTGVFYNHRAMDVLRRVAPPVTEAENQQAILDAQTFFASCGITCFHDNNVRGVETIKLYQQMSQDGRLKLRNEIYLTLEWPKDMEHVSQVLPLDGSLTHFAGYKFLIDGQGPTAYTHEKHNGAAWELPTWDPEEFKATIETLHKTGLQICTHCIGDAATDLVLDAYEAAMNADPRSDPRHRIEHAIITTPEATPRMKDLGVVVSAQPAFIYAFGDGWKTLFTPAQMERIIMTREWLSGGVHLCIGSDAPSMPLYYPQATLAGAMTRYTKSLVPLGVDQVLTFTEALRAHTIEGAYSAHREADLGSLEPGKLADLVIWKEDPENLTNTELANTKTVDLTMVDGQVVYSAA
jgi:predicted amidohydrolase YtcJ